MKKPVRIAVIGSGRWGTNIIRTLKTLSGVEVAYVVTRDYQTLISKNDIDAVVVATPPKSHVTVALPFIKKGLPVFIEKPLSLSLTEGKRLLRASRESGSLVFVGHIHLYNPAFIEAKKEIGKAGKLTYLLGEGMSNGPFRDDYSALWDWAPHDLSMMLAIAKEIPRSVEAWGLSITRPKTRLHDITILKLLFPSGLVGVIHSSKLSPEKRRKLTVQGSKHTVAYDDTLPEQKVTVYKGHAPKINTGRVIENQPVLSHPLYENVSPLTRELEAFLQMIKTKKKPVADIESGLAVVQILEAAEKSMSAGGKKTRI